MVERVGVELVKLIVVVVVPEGRTVVADSMAEDVDSGMEDEGGGGTLTVVGDEEDCVELDVVVVEEIWVETAMLVVLEIKGVVVDVVVGDSDESVTVKVREDNIEETLVEEKTEVVIEICAIEVCVDVDCWISVVVAVGLFAIIVLDGVEDEANELDCCKDVTVVLDVLVVLDEVCAMVVVDDVEGAVPVVTAADGDEATKLLEFVEATTELEVKLSPIVGAALEVVVFTAPINVLCVTVPLPPIPIPPTPL